MRGIVKYLLLLWTGIMTASCIFDADLCVMPVDEARSILFTVSLDNPMTRAIWDEDYPSEEEISFDVRLVPEELRVVVLAQDGTRIGTIQNLDYWPMNESHTEFQFVGQLPDAFATHFNANDGVPNYKFMVLANCGENQSGEEYITYPHTQLNPSAENGSIPMWGVKQVDMTPLMNEQSMDLGEIWLLRAAAQIRVTLSDALKAQGTTSIKAATLKYYNQTGYCLPSGWSQVTDTRYLDQENCIRLYRHAAVNLPLVKDETTGDYYVYVAEYDNINYSGERNKINLEFTINGVDKYFEDAISFCDYQDGKPLEDAHYNIVRNHIYEFEVLSIAGDNLVLNYEVADWNAEDWGDGKDYEEHELTYPTYHNPVVPEEYLNLTSEQIAHYTITQQPLMYFNANDQEEGAFECFFQIVGPEDVKWKPVFAASAGSYAVKVYNSSEGLVYDTTNDQLSSDLGVCTDTNRWFRIVVFPRNGSGAGTNEVDFMISYYQSWTEQYIHLYINGEYDHIRWPESGNNPKIIKIKHVAQPGANQIDE